MKENTEELLTLKEKLTDLESKIKMQRDLYIPALANAHSIAQELINEGAFDVAKAYIDFLKGKEKQEKPNHITISPVGKKTMKKNDGADFGPDTKGTKTSGIQEALNKAYSESEEVKGTNPVDRR